jgi:hypothetical protein
MFVKGAVLPWERGCGKIGRRKGGMTDAYRTGADEKSGEHGADLILFPEVQLTEFFPQYEGRDVRRYRLGLESPEVQAFREASREWNIWASPNVYLEENGKAYDASLLIGADGQIAPERGGDRDGGAPKVFPEN